MTEKLYYKDAYTKSFTARVLSCEPHGDGYAVILDKTAFFPEEGGQYSDKGTVDGVAVIQVLEKDGIIYHILQSPVEIGKSIHGELDFSERYDKMQCHTAEHILSGLFHKLYGCENVGFHLGADEVTMDIDAVLGEEEIRAVEERANSIIYENVPVTSFFPSEDELFRLEYRSKLDIRENVRIVNIGEYDSCACCAPHVSASGEVGVIKILDFMKHRGGTRLFITAGKRAYLDYCERYNSVRAVSRLLSVPKNEVADGVLKLSREYEELKLSLKSAREELFLSYADKVTASEGNLVLHFEDASQEDARILANALSDKISGICVILFGKEPEFKYLITSNSENLKLLAPEINKALSGRGGGKPEAIQGSFNTSLENIKQYFNA